MVEKRWSARLGLALALTVPLALPAEETADAFPDGCVSCHVDRTGTIDMRLHVLLREIGHPDVSRVRRVPRDCLRCHRPDEDSDDPPLSALVHEIHYDIPTANSFVTIYEGECGRCHRMDPDEGEAHVKIGRKNW